MSFFAVEALMDSIWDYYQTPGSLTFVFSVVFIFVISAVVIGYKVFNAATTNPVNTLRAE
jgi:hypothetical protein